MSDKDFFNFHGLRKLIQSGKMLRPMYYLSFLAYIFQLIGNMPELNLVGTSKSIKVIKTVTI